MQTFSRWVHRQDIHCKIKNEGRQGGQTTADTHFGCLNVVVRHEGLRGVAGDEELAEILVAREILAKGVNQGDVEEAAWEAQDFKWRWALNELKEIIGFAVCEAEQVAHDGEFPEMRSSEESSQLEEIVVSDPRVVQQQTFDVHHVRDWPA